MCKDFCQMSNNLPAAGLSAAANSVLHPVCCNPIKEAFLRIEVKLLLTVVRFNRYQKQHTDKENKG